MFRTKRASKPGETSDPLLSQDAALALATEMISDSASKPIPAAANRHTPLATSEAISAGAKKSTSGAPTIRSSSHEEVAVNSTPPVRKMSHAQSERLKTNSPAQGARKSTAASKGPVARTPRAGAAAKSAGAGEEEDELAAFFKRKKEVSRDKSVKF